MFSLGPTPEMTLELRQRLCTHTRDGRMRGSVRNRQLRRVKKQVRCKYVQPRTETKTPHVKVCDTTKIDSSVECWRRWKASTAPPMVGSIKT